MSDTDDLVSYFGESSTESSRPEFQREDSGVHGVFHRESTFSQLNKDSRLSFRERQGKDAISEYQPVSAVEVHPEQAERALLDYRNANPLRRQMRMDRNLSDKDLLLRASGDSDNSLGEKYSDMQIDLKTFKDSKSTNEMSDITKDTYVNKWTSPPGRKYNVTFGETSEHEHSQNSDGDTKQDKGVRIRKLQSDLIRIQQELQDLGKLEVSQV